MMPTPHDPLNNREILVSMEILKDRINTKLIQFNLNLIKLYFSQHRLLMQKTNIIQNLRQIAKEFKHKFFPPIFRCFKFFLVILSIAISQHTNAELNGEIKHNFINSARKSCYDVQRQASGNINIPNKTLKQYCQCYAEYISNMLNNQLVIEMENGNIPMNPSLPNLAGAYCKKNYENYKSF